MLKCIYASTKMIDVEFYGSSRSGRVIGWQKENNAMIGNFMIRPAGAFETFDYSRVGRIFRDGTTKGIGGYYNNYRASSYIPSKDKILYGEKQSGLDRYIIKVDSFTGFINGSGIFNNKKYTNFQSSGCIDYLNKIGYSQNGSNIQKIDLETDTVLSTIPLNNTGSCIIFWTKEGYLLSLSAQFDTVSVVKPTDGSVILQSSLPSNWYHAAFDQENNILIAIMSDKTVRHYVLEKAVGNLSAVTKEHASVKTGVGEHFYVTVTGDGGEPVENCWVKWSITPVIGSLYREYSKTDETGRATMLYYPPLVSGDTITITAEVIS
jgi:hypothetical protein